MYFVGHFENDYLETAVVLRIRFKWIRHADSPARNRKLKYLPWSH